MLSFFKKKKKKILLLKQLFGNRDEQWGEKTTYFEGEQILRGQKQPLYPQIAVSVCLSIHPSIHPSIFLSICLRYFL